MFECVVTFMIDMSIRVFYWSRFSGLDVCCSLTISEMTSIIIGVVMFLIHAFMYRGCI